MQKILIMLCFVPIFSFASTKFDKKVDECKSISNSEQRLGCYDTLFERTIERKVDDKNMGNWLVVEDVSPIDDSKSVYLYLYADSNITTRFKTRETPYLVIRCRENKTELYIEFKTYIGMYGIYPTTRIDSQKAISNQKWGISTDYKAIFYSGKTISFIKGLLNKNQLFIQITPFSENPVNTTFTLTGLNEAIKPLRSACGW